jgi:hypothetical protein
MSEANYIYVVTKGQYSDYGIDSVFTKKDEAEQYVAEFNKTEPWDDARVEGWPVDTVVGLVCRPCWKVIINVENGEIELSMRDGERKDYWETKELAKPEQRADPFDVVAGLHWRFLTATSFVSPEHAKKLAVERRQEILRLKANV